MKKASIEKICWKDIHDKVTEVNPSLAKIIDDIDPGKEFPLYRARKSAMPTGKD